MTQFPSAPWRILPLSPASAALNMAIDEAVSRAVASGGPPTIRFYTWNPSAVSIGTFQCLDDEVSRAFCSSNGIDIVRRITGGGAVYHDRAGEVTYSVIAPQKLFGGITESYREICGWLISGLAALGLQAEFKPINDILVAGKKVSGNAQTRRNSVLLQHGTVLYDLDVRTMFSCLKVPKEKISDKLIASVEERVTRIRDHAPQATLQSTYEALLKGFTANKSWQFGALTPTERSMAQNLVRKKYGTEEWVARR